MYSNVSCVPNIISRTEWLRFSSSLPQMRHGLIILPCSPGRLSRPGGPPQPSHAMLLGQSYNVAVSLCVARRPSLALDGQHGSSPGHLLARSTATRSASCIQHLSLARRLMRSSDGLTRTPSAHPARPKIATRKRLHLRAAHLGLIAPTRLSYRAALIALFTTSHEPFVSQIQHVIRYLCHSVPFV